MLTDHYSPPSSIAVCLSVAQFDPKPIYATKSITEEGVPDYVKQKNAPLIKVFDHQPHSALLQFLVDALLEGQPYIPKDT